MATATAHDEGRFHCRRSCSPVRWTVQRNCRPICSTDNRLNPVLPCRARETLLRCLWVIAALSLAGCKPIGGSFERVDVDAHRHFVLGKPLEHLPVAGAYYNYHRGAFVDSADHLWREAGTTKIALSLHTDLDRKLFQTVRWEPVLSGPYGIVTLEKNLLFRSTKSRVSKLVECP